MIDDSEDPQAIERDLAETRARMDQRLDELQEKLKPGQMVNETISYLGGGQNSSEAADKLISLAKANPMPAALIGAGLGWFLVERLTSQRQQNAQRLQNGSTGAGGGQSPVGDGGMRDPSMTEATHAWEQRKAQRAQSSAGSGAVGKVKDAARRLSDKVTDSRAATRLRASASRIDRPIAMGGLTALAGLVAGALLPVTEQEESWLTSTAGDLRSTGSELGQRLVARGSDAARAALGT